MAADGRSWTLRFVEPDDEEGILNVLIGAFGRWPRIDLACTPIEHLRWKLRTDRESADFHVVAVEGTRVVACTFGQATEYRIGGERIPGALFLETAVDPAYQGRGIMRDLWTFEPGRFGRSFRVTLTPSDNDAVEHKIATAGWGRPFANVIEELKRPVARTPDAVAADKTRFQIRDIARFDERVDVLLAEASETFDLIRVRHVDDLNWRYADRRAGIFMMRAAEQDGALLGYCVVARTGDRATIADVLALPGREDAVASLVRDTIVRVPDGVTSIRAWSPRHHPYRAVLDGLGFRPRRAMALHFGSPQGDVDMTCRSNPNALVHLTPGDTDLV